MQKLKEKGSALVGAVAFSLILSVASVGYLQLSTSASNNEIEALRDDKAFQSAESGLLLAADWIGNQNSLPGSSVDNLYTLTFGDITVTVDVVYISAIEFDLQSTATSSKLPYSKRLSWTLKAAPGDMYGTFLNGVLGNNARAQGGFMNADFDGPTHANEAMLISAAGGNVVSRFLGRTTVHDDADRHWDYGAGAHDNNNYDYGVEVASHGASWLDQNIFMAQYRARQDELTLSTVTTQDITLPVSNAVTNPNASSAEKRAYLKLNGGSATYYYYTGAGALDSSVYANIDNKIIRAQNELAVSGTVSGKTTVVTDVGYNLYPVGDITYTGFSADVEANYTNYDHTNNYGVALTNTKALALVSGKDIYIVDQWYNPLTGTVADVQGATDKVPLYITASLIAIEQGGTHRFLVDNSGNAKLSEYKGPIGKYGVRVIGSRTLDQWMQISTGATQARDFFRVFFDRRLEDGLQAPGIQGFRRLLADGTYGTLFKKGRWLEENI